MKKTNHNEKGFSLIEVLLVILILAAIGFAGYFVVKHKDNKTVTPSTTTTNNHTKTPTTVNSYAGWKTFCDNNYGGCFKYPADWKYKSNNFSGTDTNLILQNDIDSVEVSYVNTYHNSNNANTKGGFAVKAVESLTGGDTTLKVMGGYFQDYVPGYYLVDNSFIQDNQIAANGFPTIVFSPGYTNKATPSQGQLWAYDNIPVPTNDLVNKANAWFSSSDAKMALLVVESFYYK